MDVSRFLKQLAGQPFYRGQIVHVEQMPRRSAAYGRLRAPLPAPLRAQLQAQGVAGLYTHQTQAVDAVRAGEDVIVVTSTASGKTLCYNLPVLEAILEQPTARALYLYPTKALAQDQLRALRELGCAVAGQKGRGVSPLPVTIGPYDGDTPKSRRATLRKSGQIILTNPDMLHLGILPNHPLWGSFFRNLRYVVVDEAHIYRGVFGSQVACVLRRLRRVATLYGSKPQFIATSATIANPAQHFAALTSVAGRVIDADGSPTGPRSFALWNPPFIDRALTTRRSANSEATHLFTSLVRNETRTIVFTRARKVAELILRYARAELRESERQRSEGRRGRGSEGQRVTKSRSEAERRGSEGQRSIDGAHSTSNVPHSPFGIQHSALSSRIAAYRAGYTPEQRRQIERDLFEGRLLGVTATTALELGIDVGGLDAAVLLGFPGTIASLWQQAGRAGRGDEPSLAVLIALDNPLDQYYMRHPQELFGRPHEHALIDPDNVYVLLRHLPCAAHEAPITNLASPGHFDDEQLFGPGFVQAMVQLEEQERLTYRGDRWTYNGGDYPAEGVNLRSMSGRRFAILNEADNFRTLEEVEASSAAQRVHPGAVYLHQGESFLVVRFDADQGFAVVRPAEVDYYTQVREWSDVRIIRSLAHRPIPGGYAYFGQVRTTSQVIGYRRLRHYTEEVLGEELLDLPPTTFETTALWWDLSAEIVGACNRRGLDFLGGIHASEHAAIGILPLFAMCDRWDIGGLSTPRHADTGGPQVFIYDGFPGGVGIAEQGFRELSALWQATWEVVTSCPCQGGCPSCIQSPKCGNNNEPLDKAAAGLILGMLLQR